MMSQEQFTQLLERLPAAQPARAGSFINCNYSYNGVKDAEVVEAFLSAVKRMADIGDVTALSELPILLKGEAGVWWLGIKNDVSSWTDFELRLRENFAPVREPYLIFLDITQEKQLPGTSTEEFVRRKRLLFSQLPSPQSETNQLDMIFGLLRLDIREKVTRAEVKDFKDLLKATQAAEHVLKEKDRAVLSTEVNECEQDSRPTPIRKPRCRFCKNFGHTTETCRKLAARRENPQKDSKSEAVEAVTQFPSPSTPRFKCFGCGAPGVVRSNCSTCHSKRMQQPPPEIGFCSVATAIDARDRPVVYVERGGVSGAAYLDTCAKSSIASYSLYCQLKKQGYEFKELPVGITLADGVPKHQDVLVTRAPVKLNDRTVSTTLLVLPNSRRNRTLLGVGFIRDAHINLSLPQCTWHFIDDPSEQFELYEESFVFGGQSALAAITPDDDHIMSPSLPEESNSGRAYGPLIRIDAPTPPRKKRYPGYNASYSPILEALYADAKNSLENYDEECDFDGIDDTLFPSTSITSVDVTVLDEFLERNQDVFKANEKPDDEQHDLREIITNENFVKELTPRLLMMADTLIRAREIHEGKEEKRKELVDKKRQPCPNYQPGDMVLATTHVLSKSSQGFTSKLAPRRDGPYVILRRHGPSSFEIATTDSQTPVGIYHASALTAYRSPDTSVPQPTLPIRKRSRPKKQVTARVKVTRPRGRPPKARQ